MRRYFAKISHKQTQTHEKIHIFHLRAIISLLVRVSDGCFMIYNRFFSLRGLAPHPPAPLTLICIDQKPNSPPGVTAAACSGSI